MESFGKYSYGKPIVHWNKNQSNLKISKYSYGKPIVHWNKNQSNLKIGKFCSIGSNVNIYLGGNHMSNWITTYPFGFIKETLL